MTVSDRIRERRELMHMSQDELALKMGLKGKSSISKIESSGDKVSLKTIEKIAPLLNCSIQYLMGWDEEPTGNSTAFTKEELRLITEHPELGELFKVLFKATPEQRRQILAISKALLQQE